MAKRSIAFIIGDLCVGGWPTFLLNLAPRLKDFDLHFVATDNPNINEGFKKLGKTAYIKVVEKNIAQYLSDNKIDIVQYGNKAQYKNAAIQANVPLIIERTAGPRSCGLSKKGIHHVIASNDHSISLIRKSYKGDLTLIHNGVDIKKIDKTKPKRHFADGDFIVCYCARIGGQGQGFQDLITSVIDARKIAGDSIKLVLIGDKPEHAAENILPKLKSMSAVMKGDCVFTGLLNNPCPVIAGADVYVSPAWHHGLSNSVLEAMCLKKAVISTNVGGMREAVEDRKSGYLIDAKDVIRMKEKILLMFYNKGVRDNMGLRGRQIIEEKFNIEKQAQKYIDLYNKLCP